tara:strand:- start:428 stop:580 length:153 start_codon:yes stop_codon:yes gene_type:complete
VPDRILFEKRQIGRPMGPNIPLIFMIIFANPLRERRNGDFLSQMARIFNT